MTKSKSFKICNVITKKGKRCHRKAMIRGICTLHFLAIRTEERNASKKKRGGV
jgi:hypothetical protein